MNTNDAQKAELQGILTTLELEVNYSNRSYKILHISMQNNTNLSLDRINEQNAESDDPNQLFTMINTHKLYDTYKLCL